MGCFVDENIIEGKEDLEDQRERIILLEELEESLILWLRRSILIMGSTRLLPAQVFMSVFSTLLSVGRQLIQESGTK